MLELINQLRNSDLVRAASGVISIRILGIGTNYLFTFVVARYYGAGALGSFVLAQTILMISAIIGRLGLDTALVRFISAAFSMNQLSKLRKTYFLSLTLVIGTSLLVSLLVFLGARWISVEILKKPNMVTYIRAAAVGITPLAMLFIHSESFRGLKKIVYYSIFRNMTIPLISSIVLLIFYYLNFQQGLFPLYSHLLAIFILSAVSLLLWQKNMPPAQISGAVNVNPNSLLRVSLPMLLSSSMAYIMQWTSVLILAIYVTEREIGIYNVANKISLVTSISLFAINSMAAPMFAELFAKGNMRKLEKVVHRSTRLIFLSSTPVLLIFLIFPTFFLQIFGAEYMTGKSALILLTLAQFINACSGSVGVIMKMTNEQKAFQNIIIVAMLINICLNLMLVPIMGIKGAALSSLISTATWNISSILVIRRRHNILTVFTPTLLRGSN